MSEVPLQAYAWGHGTTLGAASVRFRVTYVRYRGTSPIRKRPHPKNLPKTLDIGPRKGPSEVRFFISEVSL